MPYIKHEDRGHFAAGLAALKPQTEGELNYVITMLCLQYRATKGASYATYNAVIGVLECAKLEMYRRQIAAYEDIKRKENGDVQ